MIFRLQKGFHRALRQLGEGFVCRCKYRKRAGALQCVHQSRGLYRGNQRSVVG